MLPHCCGTHPLNKHNLKNTPNTSYYELYNPKTYTYIYQRSALLKVHSTKNSTKITQECCTTTLRTRWKKNCREWAITSMSRCGNSSDNAQKFSEALQMQTTMTLFPAMSSIPNAVKRTTQEIEHNCNWRSRRTSFPVSWSQRASELTANLETE